MIFYCFCFISMIITRDHSLHYIYLNAHANSKLSELDYSSSTALKAMPMQNKNQNHKVYFHILNKRTITNKKIHKTNDVQYNLI